MIFLEKKGRFGNFLFQYFLAKFVQDLNPQKIIVFSKNENIYSFNSKKNIDSLVDQYYSLPKFSKILNYIKNKFYQINDENFQDVNKEEILSKKYSKTYFLINLSLIVLAISLNLFSNIAIEDGLFSVCFL